MAGIATGNVGGAAFGDHLVDKPDTGRAIRLDGDAKFGTRYTISAHERFGLQFAAGATPTKVRYAQGGDVDVDVYTVDANLLVNQRSLQTLVAEPSIQ